MSQASIEDLAVANEQRLWARHYWNIAESCRTHVQELQSELSSCRVDSVRTHLKAEIADCTRKASEADLKAESFWQTAMELED